MGDDDMQCRGCGVKPVVVCVHVVLVLYMMNGLLAGDLTWFNKICLHTGQTIARYA